MPTEGLGRIDRQKRAVIWVAILAVTVVGIVGGVSLWQVGKRLATKSTAQAICSALAKEAEAGRLPLPLKLEQPADYDVFMSELSTRYNLDV